MNIFNFHLIINFKKCRKKNSGEIEVSDVEENIYKDNDENKEELKNFLQNLEPYQDELEKQSKKFNLDTDEGSSRFLDEESRKNMNKQEQEIDIYIIILVLKITKMTLYTAKKLRFCMKLNFKVSPCKLFN